MKSAFKWVSGNTTREHLTDRVEVSLELDADEDELLDGTLYQDVRAARIVVELETLIKPGASAKTLAQIYLDLVRATEIQFFPAALRLDAGFRVVADLRDRTTLRAVRSGTLLRARRLRLRSYATYAPGSTLLTELAGDLSGSASPS